MRLDSFLYLKGLAPSRTAAKALIEEGAVYIAGNRVVKPAYEVPPDEDRVLILTEGARFVSRGGKKLEAALDRFDVAVTDAFAIDVGASSGGFTDCLLRRGARHVLAVDSGSDQLSPALRRDPRVSVYENYNARYLTEKDFPYRPTLAVMDVSFISATLILPALYELLSEGGELVLLIKPQFEVGRAFIGKGGIVRDEKARAAAVAKVVDFAEQLGFVSLGLMESPITGGDGNVEYLAHFGKRSAVL